MTKEDDEKGVGTADTPGGEQRMTVISESGLYALIFTSRKEAARAFRRWVTGTVLPALRRTGRYELAEAESDERRSPTESASLERVRTELALVREVRLTWGVPAARRIWPTLTSLPAPPAAAPPDPHAEARAEVARFLEEATIRETDARIAASRLYNAYCAWCATDDRRPITSTAFGYRLQELGWKRRKAGSVYYLGLRLRDTAAEAA